MSSYSLTCNPSRATCCAIPRRVPTMSSSSISSLSFSRRYIRGMQMQLLSHVNNRYSCYRDYRAPILHTQRDGKVRMFVSASFGDMADSSILSSAIFPRIHVKDPYQRLGISRDASEEEIQAARNFLVSKYAGHKPSVVAIESAYDDILMQSFFEKRKRPIFNPFKVVGDFFQTPVMKAAASRFQAPSRPSVIVKRAVFFFVLGMLSVLFPTEEGPTLQVAISLAACIYFIHERLKNGVQAFFYGVGAFFISWFLGTFLMVSVIPPLLYGPRSLEVGTALVTYVLLWVFSTYLK